LVKERVELLKKIKRISVPPIRLLWRRVTNFSAPSPSKIVSIQLTPVQIVYRIFAAQVAPSTPPIAWWEMHTASTISSWDVG